MRRLVTLSSEEQARALGEVLEGERVEHRVDVVDGGADVWVLRDDRMDLAREILEEWREDPEAERFIQAAATAAMRRKARAAELARKDATQARLDRAQRPLRPGLVTIGVLVLSTLLTLLGIGSFADVPGALTSLPNREAVDWLYFDALPIFEGPSGAYIPFLYSIRNGEVWRLITPAFVHSGGLFHLAFNAYWFYHLGRQIETRKGTLYLAFLVFMTTVLSFFAQYAVGWSLTDVDAYLGGTPPDYGLFHRIYLGGPIGGGLSGVVYGLFGYILAKSYTDKFSGLGVPSSTVALLLIWLVICFAGAPQVHEPSGTTLTVGVAGPIANLAHLGGLLAGGLWGLASHRIRPSW